LHLGRRCKRKKQENSGAITAEGSKHVYTSMTVGANRPLLRAMSQGAVRRRDYMSELSGLDT
jgi:hypothetical protein